MNNDQSEQDRVNNFNILRLFFAALVIVCHSPEIIDGNSSREILTRIFGTITSGVIAVDGFFLLSGYLITESFCRSSSAGSYLAKRVLRIYPAYLVTYILCICVVAPLAGATAPGPWRIFPQALKAVLLTPPGLGGEFQGMPFPNLNIAMWTISFEFRCYLLVALLGLIGVLQRRWFILLSALLLIGINAFQLARHIDFPLYHLLGDAASDVRLTGLFLVGSCFYLFRDKVRYRGDVAAIAALAVIGFMFGSKTAEAAFATLGAYAIFWFAFRGPFRAFSSGLTTDISYGLYLYAWPIQSLIVFYSITKTPWLVTLMALPIAALLGLVSWILIEKPAKSLTSHWKRFVPAFDGSDRA